MNIGLVPNRVESARANYRWLQAALTAHTPITLPAGDIYLDAADDGPLVTPATVSCGRIDATTGGGYSIDPTPQQGRIGTRLLWRSGGAFLRVRGAGLIVNGPLEIIGDSTSDAIQLEGRSEPATGRHSFTGLRFRNWGCAFHCLAEPAEQHADNSKVCDCETANVGCVFRSDNQQAVNWYFGGLVVNNLGGPVDQFVCDIRRGGLVTIDRLICCHPRVTIFRVRDYSPHNCSLAVNHLEFDRFETPARLTLFQYAGPIWPDMGWLKWRVRASGFVCQSDVLDLAKWLDIPDEAAVKKLNRSDIRWDVTGVAA